MVRKKRKLFIMLLIIGFIGMCIIDFVNNYKKDGVYLIPNNKGPFVYANEIYVRSDLNSFPESRETSVLGSVRKSWLDGFTIVKQIKKLLEVQKDIIGDVNDSQRNYLKIRGERDVFYTKASALEENGDIEKVLCEYDDFIIRECKIRYYSYNDFQENNASSAEELQSFKLPKGYVEELREEFGAINLSVSDFKRSDQVYLLLAGTPDMTEFIDKYYNGIYRISEVEEDFQSERLNPYFYVCFIFYENGEVYYGNYENKITGEIKECIIQGINTVEKI